MLKVVAQWLALGLAAGLLVCIQGLVFSDYSIRQVAFIFSAAVVMGLLVGTVYAVIYKWRSR